MCDKLNIDMCNGVIIEISICIIKLNYIFIHIWVGSCYHLLKFDLKKSMAYCYIYTHKVMNGSVPCIKVTFCYILFMI